MRPNIGKRILGEMLRIPSTTGGKIRLLGLIALPVIETVAPGKLALVLQVFRSLVSAVGGP